MNRLSVINILFLIGLCFTSSALSSNCWDLGSIQGTDLTAKTTEKDRNKAPDKRESNTAKDSRPFDYKSWLIQLENSFRGKKVIVFIVDPISSATLIPVELRELLKHAKNLKIVSIESGLANPNLTRSDKLDETIKGASDHKDRKSYETAIKRKMEDLVKGYDEAFVLPGGDAGTGLYHELNLHLASKKFPVTTHEENSNFRDKAVYGEALKRLGIQQVQQALFSDESPKAALTWAKSNLGFPSQPVAIKPTDAAGSFQVHRVTTEKEFEDTYRQVLGKKDRAGKPIDKLLIQPWVGGFEFAVDLVRYVDPKTGKVETILSDLWQYGKVWKDGKLRYNDDKILDPQAHQDLIQSLLRFTANALDALGHRVGWVHAEVKDGKIILDIGDRLPGSMIPEIVAEATGVSSVKLGIAAFMRPELLESVPRIYSKKKYGYLVSLFSELPPPYQIHSQAQAMMDAVVKMPGVLKAKLNKTSGWYHEDSGDLDARVGYVEVVADSEQEAQATIQKIRSMPWTTKGIIGIAHPTSTGSAYVGILLDDNYEVVEAGSQRPYPSGVGMVSPEIRARMSPTVRVQDVEKWRQLAPVAIIPGGDGGVPDALWLRSQLNQKGASIPDYGHNEAHFDKGQMAQKLKAAGLRHAKGISIPAGTDWGNFKNALFEAGFLTPEGALAGTVFFKPSRSFMSDDAGEFSSLEKLWKATEKALDPKKTNVHGERNLSVEIQEFLPGPEYVVNLASYVDPATGRVRYIVTDVWIYKKQARKVASGEQRPFYDYDMIQDPTDPALKEIVQYALQSASAMGLRIGPAHMEIMKDAKGAPVLTDWGGRLVGSGLPRLIAHATGFDIVKIAADAFVAHRDQKALKRLRALPDIIPIARRAAIVSYFTPAGHVLTNPNLDQLIQQVSNLPNLKKIISFTQAGKALPEPKALNDQILQFELGTEDLSPEAYARLQRDLEFIRYEVPWTLNSIQAQVLRFTSSFKNSNRRMPVLGVGGLYSTGRSLGELAAHLGFRVFGIQSRSWPAESPSPLGNQIPVISLSPSDSFDSGVTAVNNLNMQFVLAGAEREVPTTHKLQNQITKNLLHPVNPDGTQFTNKPKFYNLLERSGLDVATWSIIETGNEESIIDNFFKSQLSSTSTSTTGQPLAVLKPVDGSSGSGVVYIQSASEGVAAMRRLRALYPTTQFLIQRYLEGPEYAVNIVVGTTPAGEQHFVLTDIWSYVKRSKPGFASVYDYEDLMDPSTKEELTKALFSTVQRATIAQGLKLAAVHAEVKLVNGKFFVIDYAARAMGQNQPRIAGAATGRSQLDLLLLAMVAPDEFRRVPSIYKIYNHATFVNLMAPDKNLVLSEDVLDLKARVSRLPSVRHLQVKGGPGASVPEATDLSHSYGVAHLIHPSPVVIERDREIIRSKTRWLSPN